MLKVSNVGLRFGGIHAIQNISFEAQTGQVLRLIGPNGAARRRSSTASPASTGQLQGV